MVRRLPKFDTTRGTTAGIVTGPASGTTGITAPAVGTIATAIVNISDQYDNLTRRHTLSRLVDGRVQETITTDDDAVVRQWLTTLTRLPLCETSKLDPNRDYYVRISARTRPYGNSILGWTSAVTGQAKFTFIP